VGTFIAVRIVVGLIAGALVGFFVSDVASLVMAKCIGTYYKGR
jgi:Na+/H+-dicarboxylate symporter